MKFTVITLFPRLIEAFAAEGLLGSARDASRLELATLNPRVFTEDVHQTVDDRAFGGGDGMVMKVEPLARAVRSLGEVKRVVTLSPQGRVWRQSEAEQWAREGGHIVLVCGRYAGIDHRFNVRYATDEISVGDYILNGGELAAGIVIESVARLLPGVLGNPRSLEQDSFSARIPGLECPQFTRPREIEGLPVPEPLLSGHHARIEKFQAAVQAVRTARLRPDLVPPGQADTPEFLRAEVALLEVLSDVELLALGLTRADLREFL